jgi:hypothetical protein
VLTIFRGIAARQAYAKGGKLSAALLARTNEVIE